MGDVRACAYVLVTLLSFQLVAGKPFLDVLWCYLICDDDDSSGSAGAYEDIFDYEMCDCGPKAATTAKPTAAPQPQIGPFSMMIPPSNGMNLTMTNTGAGWQMNVVPWPGAPAGQAAPAPGAAVAPAPVAAPGAAPAPGAPAAPPAAAAPATTLAPAATTAAATTAAPTTAAAGK